MKVDTFYKTCISACVFMIFLNLAMSVVGSLGIFETYVPTTYEGKTAPEVLENFSGSSILDFVSGNFASYLLEGSAILGGFLVVVAIAGRTGVSAWVSAYLFGLIFFGSWQSSLTIFAYGGWFDIPAMAGLFTIVTVGMIIMFAAAVIGMFGGQ